MTAGRIRQPVMHVEELLITGNRKVVAHPHTYILGEEERFIMVPIYCLSLVFMSTYRYNIYLTSNTGQAPAHN